MIDSCEIESLRGDFALGPKTDLGPFKSAFSLKFVHSLVTFSGILFFSLDTLEKLLDSIILSYQSALDEYCVVKIVAHKEKGRKPKNWKFKGLDMKR